MSEKNVIWRSKEDAPRDGRLFGYKTQWGAVGVARYIGGQFLDRSRGGVLDVNFHWFDYEAYEETLAGESP